MNEEHHLGRPSAEDQFERGDANNSSGNNPSQQMEAQPGVFEAGQRRINGPVDELRDVPADQLTRYGDSRADETDPKDAHFEDISEDPRMTTMRDPNDQPVVRREDPERLAAQRVDQNDEWVARPTGPEFDREEAILRARVSKKGDESEGL